MNFKNWVRTEQNPQYKGRSTEHWHFLEMTIPKGHKLQAGDTYTYGDSRYVLDKVEYRDPTLHCYWTKTKVEGKYDPIGHFKRKKG